jgi:hypothetical protein
MLWKIFMKKHKLKYEYLLETQGIIKHNISFPVIAIPIYLNGYIRDKYFVNINEKIDSTLYIA